MNEYPAPTHLAIHTIWHEGISDDSVTKFVFVVNLHRRRILRLSLLGNIFVIGCMVAFPQIAVVAGIATLALTAAAIDFGNSGGTGYYTIHVDAGLSLLFNLFWWFSDRVILRWMSIFLAGRSSWPGF